MSRFFREEEEDSQVENSDETPYEEEESDLPQSMKEKIARANRLMKQIRKLKEEVEQEESELEKEMKEMEAEDEMLENWFNEEEDFESEPMDEEELSEEELEEEWGVNSSTEDPNLED